MDFITLSSEYENVVNEFISNTTNLKVENIDKLPYSILNHQEDENGNDFFEIDCGLIIGWISNKRHGEALLPENVIRVFNKEEDTELGNADISAYIAKSKPNISYYLNNTTYGQECDIFKDFDRFENSADKVCYIGDYGLQKLANSPTDLTDEEIISSGIGVSRNMIISLVKEYSEGCDFTDEKIADIAEYLFEEADWCYMDTYAYEFDYTAECED